MLGAHLLMLFNLVLGQTCMRQGATIDMCLLGHRFRCSSGVSFALTEALEKMKEETPGLAMDVPWDPFCSLFKTENEN